MPFDDDDRRVYAKFEDTWGHTVCVVESSIAGYAGVYIFCEDGLGRSVTHHFKDSVHYETAPVPEWGDNAEGKLVNIRDGWTAMSPHLNPEQTRLLIKALQAHLTRNGEDLE